MKKLIMSILTVIFCLTFINAITLCQEETDIGDIPCLGLTTISYCSGNISVININTSVQSNISVYAVGDGTYNFTFDYPKGSYSLIDCQNKTATITIGNYAGITNLTWILIISVAIALGLFAFGFLRHEMIYFQFAGFIVVANGIVILTNNIPQITALGSLVTLTVGAILIAVGVICFVYNFFEEGRD